MGVLDVVSIRQMDCQLCYVNRKFFAETKDNTHFKKDVQLYQ